MLKNIWILALQVLGASPASNTFSLNKHKVLQNARMQQSDLGSKALMADCYQPLGCSSEAAGTVNMSEVQNLLSKSLDHRSLGTSTLQIWESFPVSSLNSPTFISCHSYRTHSTYEKLELISTNSNASWCLVKLLECMVKMKVNFVQCMPASL